MAAVAVAFPVLPGKADEARRFAQELMGPRRSEAEQAFRRFGFTREAWYLQSTPQGDLIIAYVEADDPARAFREWAAADDPFNQWYKQQTGAISGLDFNQPPPALPEEIFDWSVG